MIKVRKMDALEEHMYESKKPFNLKSFVEEMLNSEKDSETSNSRCQELPSPVDVPVTSKIQEDDNSAVHEENVTVDSESCSPEGITTGILDTLGPEVRSKIQHDSFPIVIRIKKNRNNYLESELINEIYTSPRKLTIPLTRVDEVHADFKMQTSPVHSKPSVSDETAKATQASTVAQKRTSTRKIGLEQTSSSKKVLVTESPLKVQQFSTKRKLNMESTDNGSCKTHKSKRLPKDEIRTVDPHASDEVIVAETESSDDDKMESVKKSLQSFIKESVDVNNLNNMQNSYLLKLPRVKEWDSKHLLRCHSPKNLIDDSSTQVWRCVFEPSIGNPGSTSSCVATCGGNTMCIIDCSTGKTKFRYKDCNASEEFYALDWTTIKLENYLPVFANILAVGGSSGVVHLIHPSQLTCYSKWNCCTSMISSLIFHPGNPRILYCGTSSGLIVVWDTGDLKYPEYEASWSKLNTIEARSDILNINFASNFNLLIAGCENGCYGWKTKITTKTKSPSKNKLTFIHPTSENSESSLTVVDALVLLPNNNIATKCAGHGCIYIWNLETTLQSKSSKYLDICVIATLEWSQTPNFFLNMGASSDGGILACGDTKGQIWLYNISKLIKQKKLSSQIYSPSDIIGIPNKISIAIDEDNKMYDWKSVIINAVAINSDQRYLIASCDKNLVVIWAGLE